MKLLGAQQPLSAGRKHELLCQSSGSRPPAVITWWRDGQRLDTTTETVRSSLLYRISSTLLPFLAPIPTVGVCNNVAQPTMKWPVQFVVMQLFIVRPWNYDDDNDDDEWALRLFACNSHLTLLLLQVRSFCACGAVCRCNRVAGRMGERKELRPANTKKKLWNGTNKWTRREPQDHHHH